MYLCENVLFNLQNALVELMKKFDLLCEKETPKGVRNYATLKFKTTLSAYLV